MVLRQAKALPMAAHSKENYVTAAGGDGVSGITTWEQSPWQPCVATGWTSLQVKRRFAIKLGKMLQNEPSSVLDSEVPYLKAQHVQWSGIRLDELPTMWASARDIAELSLTPGDLLVCEGGEVGRAAILGEEPPADCIIQNALHRVRPRQGDTTGFLFYLLRHAATQGWFDVLCNRSTIAHFTTDKFGEMWIALPGDRLQHDIADYLDRETARLDALVAAKERVLGLLAEKRRALITRAVTRGLDPYAPFRDSGIPWLGEIPAHWKIIQLKFVTRSLQTGPFGSQLHAEEYITGGVPVVNPSHLNSGRICADDRVSINETTAERLVIHQLYPGDVVFARRGELGRCGVVEPSQAGWLCGTGSLRARLRLDMVDPYYLVLVFTETGVSDVLTFESVGTTMDNLNSEILGSCQFGVPPLTEQRGIVAHVAAATAKLDALRSVTDRTIALLKERRAALIAAAVTGTLDVEDDA